MSARLFNSLACVVLVTTAALSSAWAAPPTAQQRAQARAAATALSKVGNLYRSKKYAEAGEALKEAQDSLSQIEADANTDVAALVAPLEKQLSKTRDLLAEEGVEIPKGKSGAAKAQASFTKQVAPLLVAKCGNCHVQRSRGDFNMGSYVALSRGSKNGSVVMPGDAQGSRIIEVLESGDMPRGGGPLSAEEIALIASWINAGAKFDGPDSAAPLVSFAKSSPQEEMPKAEITMATGKEAVQFSRDVGPLLLTHCIECHGEQNPRNQFSVNSFAQLLRGGTSGIAVVANQGSDSLLIKKLRGTAGARMPMGRDPLADAEIATIEKWIELGAKFDGPNPAMPLEELVALSVAKNSTHETLSAAREKLAAKNWHLILPDTEPRHEVTTDFVLYGSVGPEALADVARVADEQIAKIRKLFKVPADRPLVKGRMTLFTFDKRYDYGEVGTMLERRELPNAWRGHWRFTGVDAYACVLLSSDGQAAAGQMAQQITGLYIGSLGKIPRWFAEGTGRAVAVRFDSKDPRVKLWDEQVGRILRTTEKPEEFLDSQLAPEDNDILSYSFVKFLMSIGGRHAALVAALEQGAEFETAFSKAFGGTPRQLVGTWLNRVTKHSR